MNMTHLDENLNFTKKYNWWTPEKDKENISIHTKIGYVFKNKDIFEIGYVFSIFSYDDILKSYEMIKYDDFSLNKQDHNIINNLLQSKKNGEFL